MGNIDSLKRLFYAYGGKLNEEQIAVYYDYLKDYDVEKFNNVVDSLIRKCVKLPSIGEIIDSFHESEIPSEAEVWYDLKKHFENRDKIKHELSWIIKKDVPNLGLMSPEEARKQVYFSYKSHSQKMLESIKIGEKYLPTIERPKNYKFGGSDSVQIGETLKELTGD